jgi:anti-sigma factor RsiW
MTRCLDEGALQSYFDGELSGQLMESVASHLASCATCAARAREIGEETTLLTTALAAEFEASVPTESLRQRIDEAVLGVRVANAARVEKRGLFNSLAGVFSFSSQRSLGYASLVVVMAFASIIGVVKLKQQESQEPAVEQAKAVVNPATPATVASNPPSIETPVPGPGPVTAPTARIQPRHSAPKVVPVKAPVKLFPGERSYLQTIARLDSTINSNKKAMRPSLQVEYERNLAVVDRAIAATRNAAKSNPNDPDAADFMFAAYQSKVDLLNTIADARLSGGRSH